MDIFSRKHFFRSFPAFAEGGEMLPSGIGKSMEEMIHIMQVHHHGNTIPDRYPEWVTEQDSIQVCDLCLDRLCFRKVSVPGERVLLISGTGGKGTNTY